MGQLDSACTAPPRISTTFTFTGSYPSSTARLIDLNTRSCPLRRVVAAQVAFEKARFETRIYMRGYGFETSCFQAMGQQRSNLHGPTG
jgi:hypothetical protein